MLFKLEDKKELHNEVKFQWSVLRSFNLHLYYASNHGPILSYNPFSQIQYLTSFSQQFLADIEGAYILASDFPVEQGQCLLHKVSRDIFLKAINGRWGIKLFRGNSAWANLLRGCSTWEINDQMMLIAQEF